MIEVGQRYVVKEGFGQSGYVIDKGWAFTVKRHTGSQYACEFDEQYLPDYVFHDCCGECNSNHGYYVHAEYIERYCVPEKRIPTWIL